MNVQLECLADHFRRVINLRDRSYVDGWYDPALLNELNDEVVSIQPSPVYFGHLSRAIDNFAAELLASPEFHEMNANWATLDIQTTQRAYLEKCVKRLAWHQAQIGVNTTVGSIDFYCYDDPVYASDAFVGFDMDPTCRDHDGIYLNEARPRWHTDLLWALKSLVHEQTHVFNLSLNSEYFKGNIKPGHPLYEEAYYFHHHFVMRARIDSTHGKYADPQKNPYLNQLDERAAFYCDDRLHRTLETALASCDADNLAAWAMHARQQVTQAMALQAV